MVASVISAARSGGLLPSWAGLSFSRYVFAISISLAAIGARILLSPALNDHAPFLVLFMGVILASWVGGTGPGILATVVCGIGGTYLFLEEPYSWEIAEGAGANLAVFIVQACLVAWLVGSRRRALSEAIASEVVRKESEERFRLLVEGVADYAMFLLDPSGRIVSWNAGAQQIKGYREAEILGRHFSVFYPEEDRAAGKPAGDLEVAKADGKYEEEAIRIKKDGSEFWAHVLITALWEESTLRGFAKITRDITLQKKLEQAERLARASLEERVEERTAALREANAELETFACSVAHDLRAPLRAMHGFSRALLEDYSQALDEEGREYAARIVAGARRLDGLIEDLLTYARLSRAEIKAERVDLTISVGSVLEGLSEEITKRKAEVRMEEPLPWVLGHRSTVGQVISNLVSNALKFIPTGGAPVVTIRAEDEDGRVRLWVEDRGIGIAPEHQRRIFNVFERLHGVETYSGTGIGLAIVRKGVERKGGMYGVESEPGKGSRFWFELPKAKD